MIILVYCSVLAALLLFPETCADSAEAALKVWGLHVVPSLFPYMFFCKMLSDQLKRTRLSPLLVCSLLGAFGGSPSGAATINAYHAHLSQKSVVGLAALTGTISPMFFFGTVRSWTDTPQLCMKLYFSQLAGALLAAFCAMSCPAPRAQSMQNSAGISLRDERSALSQSIDAVLQVGGYIICFSVFAGMIRLLPLPDLLLAAMHALMEISGGMHTLLTTSSCVHEMLLAFVSGFGGLCILFQNLLFLRPLGISMANLTVIALLRAFLSSIMMVILP